MDKSRMTEYEKAIKTYVEAQYTKILREPNDKLSHKFIVPGAAYSHQLWDWDSYFTDMAIAKVAENNGTKKEFAEYQKGCIINFCENINADGSIPLLLPAKGTFADCEGKDTNCAKPIIAQHAEFICGFQNDHEWLKPYFPALERFIAFYRENRYHEESGLYFFADDLAIGVDNDPCTFYRPKHSSASIYLNSFMYNELLSMKKISEKIAPEKSAFYSEAAESLKTAIIDNCYDERNGFFYSCDIDLIKVDKDVWLHKGAPRHWHSIQRKIDVWSGFLTMYFGIATPEQAERMVKENLLDERIFNSPFGVRSLSKCEKMFRPIKSGNPSCWLGPIWGIANYAVYKGLLDYGYESEAKELRDKTVALFGNDIIECGEMHEYYHPETGEGLNNKGFQSWNLLAYNML